MKKNKQLNKELPNSIKIGYINYQFDFWPDSFSSTEKAQGEFFEEAGKIGLKESAIPSIQGVNTLLHEILHAVVYEHSLTCDGNVLSTDTNEEIVVNSITNGLMTVIKDNPWFLKFLQENIHGRNSIFRSTTTKNTK